MAKFKEIGKPRLRKEGVSKVTGEAKYIDDLVFPDMLHGVTVRSSVPRARVKAIHYEPGVPWDEITVVTAKDIPGWNYVGLILNDQPFLADGVVNHPEEPIVLLAHPDKYVAEEARKKVRIEYEPLPTVFSIEESLAAKTVIWGKDNLLKSYLMNKGDVDRAFRAGEIFVEGEYETGAQEQLYIENNGVIAVANAREGVTVWGSMQCPYYVHKALLPLFEKAFPGKPEKIRAIQTVTGGGFGGKEEYPSIISGHAALLAWKSGKPVKIMYDRAEDMVATTKRHPSRTKHRTALSRDGRILGMDIDFAIDGGAYATLSAVVLSRGTIHAAGPYYCENVRIRARAVATNAPPHGAFRGFGAPQSVFALERHMDACARKVGLTPEEFRRRNFLKPGGTTATGQVIREKIDLPRLLDLALKKADYFSKKKKFAREKGPIRRGIGFATFLHGAGFTGSGEKTLASVVAAEADASGRVTILSASTEIGQGTNTIFSQIAAEALGILYSDILVAQPDTARVPNSGPTVASRTAMVVGKLVEQAVLGIRSQLQGAGLLKEKYTRAQFQKACALYMRKFGKLRGEGTYRQPAHIQWDDEKYQGDAYAAYAWAAYVAQVAVDTRTYQVTVEDFVAVQEVGRVLHPVLAAGQIEGGVAQAIGFGLYEKVVWKDGRMMNGQMTNYIMPTSADLPEIRVFFLDDFFKGPDEGGPGGAKGIGELPMDGPAPALLNAVEDAVGPVGLRRIPMLPEDLMGAMG